MILGNTINTNTSIQPSTRRIQPKNLIYQDPARGHESQPETLSSSADVKGTVAKPATDLGKLLVTTTNSLVTMDPHIESELLGIDNRSTVDQINVLEAHVVTLEERASMLQERTERLDSVNEVSTAEVTYDARNRGLLLPATQSAVAEKESLSIERSMVPARSARSCGRGPAPPVAIPAFVEEDRCPQNAEEEVIYEAWIRWRVLKFFEFAEPVRVNA
ncbi:uncharacterized protein EAE98_001591 [Botrytis deweyae]|uniref:Uncharacterized protein n=1 Tax=Botrytis deweyae TaxID=2478750 RepID=A0ABQ7IY99_9HELO|nr:uncharacterized protein EAE98_001591 [Botrytis deweyae]KAF7937277.1 hypothetical protein EAE98_001591 [Botrytis deweyae]